MQRFFLFLHPQKIRLLLQCMASLLIEGMSDILSKWQYFSHQDPILHLIIKIPRGLTRICLMDCNNTPTKNIVLILSKLPEFLRESMMRSRLEELAAMDSKTREVFIDSILIGLSRRRCLEEGN